MLRPIQTAYGAVHVRVILHSTVRYRTTLKTRADTCVSAESTQVSANVGIHVKYMGTVRNRTTPHGLQFAEPCVMRTQHNIIILYMCSNTSPDRRGTGRFREHGTTRYPNGPLKCRFRIENKHVIPPTV